MCIEEEGDPFQFVHLPIVVSLLMMPQFGYSLVNSVLSESPEMIEFLKKDDEKFDVCLVEIFSIEAILVRNFKGFFKPQVII